MQQAGGDSAKRPIHGFIERTWGQRKARLDFLTAAGDEASRAATKASFFVDLRISVATHPIQGLRLQVCASSWSILSTADTAFA